MRPHWSEVFGSAGRAAAAIAAMKGRVELYGFAEEVALHVISQRAALSPTPVAIRVSTRPGPIKFDYYHGLETPRIQGLGAALPNLEISSRFVVRFGMLEGDARVKGERVVYDPQNARNPRPFRENGSIAGELALVLNHHEAVLLTGRAQAGIQELAGELQRSHAAQVVVIKRGPRGALVFDGNEVHEVPAYRSGSVWKIGSGDNFVAHFAHQWMQRGCSPAESADLASRATAFYCESRSFATPESLAAFAPDAIAVSSQFASGRRPRVYLAGPFFTLSQLWQIEQARDNLLNMGLEVFSPYHDVGLGSADDVVSLDLSGIKNSDLILAVGDGLDSGTVYEIGYGRAMNKPVVVYSENVSDEDLKMMQGSGCLLVDDYVSAIYQTLWTAASL